MKKGRNYSVARLLHPGAIAVFFLPVFCQPSAGGAPSQQPVSMKGEELTPGKVIERVACSSKPEQTYALYVPSSYSPSRLWPLIAAFDPAARGSIPVERFKEGAERYGFIVCGSNNSRNGPWAPTLEAADAMLNDVVARFRIDDKRVYITGFSGGARVATGLASMLSGRVAGVIGCGAGFATGLEPNSKLPFVYFGTVGNEDFNYPEMRDLDRALGAAGVAHRIDTFEGGHQWASPDLCVQAIEWMELQAMKAGTRTRDDAMIDRLFNKARQEASADEAAGRSYKAYVEYEKIVDDFGSLKDVSETEKKAALLKDSKAVKQAIGLDRDQEKEQLRRAGEMFALRARLTDSATAIAIRESEGAAQPDPGRAPIALGPAGNDDNTFDHQIIISKLRARIADLQKRSRAVDSTPDRALARRILNEFMASAFEPAMMLIRARKYDLAIASLSIDTQLMPENVGLLYNLACAYSLKGDKRRAIESLNKAVEKGFSNIAQIERDHDLDGIREEAGFKRIVDELKQKH